MNGLAVIEKALAAKAHEVVQQPETFTRRRSTGVPSATRFQWPSQEDFALPPGLKAFSVGSLGNFPYYWQDPRTLKFNVKTYDWISTHLKANTLPIQLDQPFINLYINAFSKVFYSLSSHDQNRLALAQKSAIKQQNSLLQAWKDAFGHLPTGLGQPIDLIMAKVTYTWASPPTTLLQLQKAQDIRSLLNQIPPSGQSVLPALANYLNSLNSSISLLNATTMNQGYLAQALAAAQSPQSNNGALLTNDGAMHPAYAIATPLKNILRGLNSKHQAHAFNLNMSVKQSSSSEYSVMLKDRETVPISPDQLLRIQTPHSEDLFQHEIVTHQTPTNLDITFSGVTMVYFGPVPFSLSSQQNWYWMDPILAAIKNGSQDISGFKFSPQPNINFSKKGPFSFLTGVAISKNPSLRLTSSRVDYEAIASSIPTLSNAQLKFLGVPLGDRGSSSQYKVSAIANHETRSVEINLDPAPTLMGDSLDSTAFVLGVLTDFPAS